MPDTEPDTASIVRGEFVKLFAENSNPEIDNTPLADLGVDSLDFFEKVLFLEEEFGIKIPISVLDNDVTLNDILDSLFAAGDE